MKTKILVIFISFIFLFTYTSQCFAVTNELVVEEIKEEIDSNAINEKTEEEIIEQDIPQEKCIEELTIEEEQNDEQNNMINEQIIDKNENIIKNEIQNEEIIKKSENNIEEIEQSDNEINKVDVEQVVEENSIGTADIKGRMYIEKPILNQSINTKNDGININLVGWAVSNDLNAKLDCFVDNQKMNVNFTRVKRRDVDNAVSGAYGGINKTPNAGFSGLLDIHTILTGTHTIKVRQLSGNNEVICEQSVSINIINPPYVRKSIYRETNK